MNKRKYQKAFSLAEITVTIIIASLLLAIIDYGLGYYEQSKLSKAKSLTKNAPMHHMSNLIIWYETIMDNNFIMNDMKDGDNVEIWHNRAINFWQKNNASQSSLVNRPIYKKKIFNDVIPGLYFDGTNDYMRFDGSLLLNSDFTFFAVEMRLRGANNNYYIGGLQNSSGQNFHMGYGGANYARFGIYGNATSNYTIDSYSQPVARINNYIFSKKNGAKFWINGGFNPDQSNAQTYYLSSYQEARIGDTQNQYFYMGNIAEIIAFNRAISDVERQDIEKYLSAKYNIDLDY